MTRRWTGLLLCAVLALGTASGCKEEGAAEKAGRAIDEAAADAGDKLEDAKDKLKD